MRGGGHHDGRGDRVLYGRAHGLGVGAFLQLYQHAGIGQVRHRRVGEDKKAVVLRVGGDLLAGDGVFRREHGAPDDEAHGPPGDVQRHRVAHGKSVRGGELLLHQAALGIGGFQRRPGAEIGLVEQRLALVDLQRRLHAVSDVLHVRGDRGARLCLGHAGGVAHAGDLPPGDGRGAYPEIRQGALLKIGLHGEIHQPPCAVQPGEHPGPQEAQQGHRDELHRVLPHVPQQLAPEHTAALHHVMSSTRIGRSLSSTDTTAPLLRRMIRLPSGAMEALWVMITTVVE